MSTEASPSHPPHTRKEHYKLRRNLTLEFDDHNLEKVKKKIMFTLFVRICVCTGEIIGGVIAGSIAVIADGMEKFSDMVYLSVSLFSVIISKKEATDNYSYGYYRAGVIGALLCTIVMWIISGVLVYSAIGRIININNEEIDGHIMLYTALGGLGINIIVISVLAYGEKAKDGEKKSKNENLKAVISDILGDAIQSILTIIASIMIICEPEKLKLADPICSLSFPIICFFVTRPIIKECLRTLMEGCPHDINPAKIKDELSLLEGVKEVTDIHIWSIANGKSSISTRIQAKTMTNQLVANIKERCLELGIIHTTIQIELAEEDEPEEAKDK